MGWSFPSFFFMKKKGAAYSDLDSRMYPLWRCSPKNLVSLASWSWDSGYILQSRVVRASSFRLIAWSSSCLGGNLSASFSLNTLECRRYLAGICSVVVIVMVFCHTHAFGQGMVTFPFSQSTWGLKVCSQG